MKLVLNLVFNISTKLYKKQRFLQIISYCFKKSDIHIIKNIKMTCKLFERSQFEELSKTNMERIVVPNELREMKWIINNKLDVADTVSVQYPDAQFLFSRYQVNDVKFSWYNREYRVSYFSPKYNLAGGFNLRRNVQLRGRCKNYRCREGNKKGKCNNSAIFCVAR